ncbi:gamma-glutamyltransferase, partial [Pantoea ananatis]
PHRGPKAALTVAGTVSGWHEALALSVELGGTPLPLARLLRDAVRYAADGIPVTASQASATRSKREELQHQPGFSALFLPDGDVPAEGSRFTQPDLARTLSLLSEEGLESFYRGTLAHHLAGEMVNLGIPVTLADLQQQRASRVKP